MIMNLNTNICTYKQTPTRKTFPKIQCIIQNYFCPSQKHFYNSKATIWDMFVAHELSMRVFPRKPRRKFL